MAEETKTVEPGHHGDDGDFEEVLVYVDFPDFDECSFMNEATVLELHDVTGPNPSCTVDNLIFKGKQELNLGTQMFFDHNDPSSVEYIGSSINVVKFRMSKIEKAPEAVI